MLCPANEQAPKAIDGTIGRRTVFCPGQLRRAVKEQFSLRVTTYFIVLPLKRSENVVSLRLR